MNQNNHYEEQIQNFYIVQTISESTFEEKKKKKKKKKIKKK